ncbi:MULTISPECIES: LysR family transcriptional regulator [Burkholderia]|uniref:LysR family transcriptional regulator n=1 Tax=Burkholderia TaxID=32008 RepID=UPI000759D236|nr:MULTISPECIES: LysR family transcriptional regulator [Burkholderia]KUZ34881.1 transcriptional regulator [Burkholderia territorii]KUZ59692.1 transcriptional regulator [Burkholderia territorii]RQS24836.1 LysR family transcriptional regulator [Burkholderia sp. Bp8995]RQS43223.1 LysR family transcriptional regulator [Burkholderia sp. Bp8989]
MDSSQRVRAILSFVQAAHSGSFSAAARNLGISSAAVSKNVASLEQALGVRLVNRTTRSLKLTSEGGAFLEQAQIALDALDALDAAVGSVSGQRVAPSGRVRISTSAAFGRNQVLPALPALLAQYRDLRVEVDFDDRRIDLVQDGYDLAIRGGQIADSSLVSRSVCQLNMALVASPAYLAEAGTPRTVQELSRHRLIGRRFLAGRLSPWMFRQTDGTLAEFAVFAPVVTVSAPEAAAQAALEGLGIAQVGVHHAWAHLRAGELKTVLTDCHHPGTYEMVLQYPHRALLAPRVRVTVDHLLDAFAHDEALHVPIATMAEFQA